MIAVLSATEDDFYAMPLPFVVYSWRKIGARVFVFVPSGDNPKLRIAEKYCPELTRFLKFDCEEKRIPTYSQVSRLFGGSTTFADKVVMITGDSDMCVFGDFFSTLLDGGVHIVGADLTPEDQYPMCYAAMPAATWRDVFGSKDYQEALSELIDPIEGQNIRGEQWCFDQWYLKKKLTEYGLDKVKFHNRSNGQNQFAQNRADRDGWHFDPYNILDAHLPRPLTDEENFKKVTDLFRIKFPSDDLSWMEQYRNEYMSHV